MTALLMHGTGRGDEGLRLYDKFAGYGGSTEGATSVPGVEGVLAANHAENAVEVHAANHPEMDHFRGDLQAYDICKFGPCDILWASPACPNWTNAKGVERTFDKANQIAIPGLEPDLDQIAERSRLLMDEVPRYLNAMWIGGQPVLAGVVENVIECRQWHDWNRWINEFHLLGYSTRVIALNAMHAQPVRTLAAPQTRDRLYVGFWLNALGRTPDWDKWLRPTAWCPRCEENVQAVQVFKDPGRDMGRYGVKSQYVYRCPRVSCRGQILEPAVLPAAEAIDWSLPSQRIGDRDEPLAPKTMARIGTGVVKFAVPFLAPSGGTWRDKPSSIDEPMPTRTTRENDGLAVPPLLAPYYSSGVAKPVGEPMGTVTTVDRQGLAVPPLLVPVEGRLEKDPRLVSDPMRTQTCRNETGLAVQPFVATLRGGGSAKTPRTTDEALSGITGGGFHHLLASPAAHAAPRPIDVDIEAIPPLVAEIERIEAQILKHPQGPKRDAARALLGPGSVRAAEALCALGLADLDFRMLEPREIGRGMSFRPTFKVFGSKRLQVRGFGNAVVAPCAEVIVSALVEAITGEELPRSLPGGAG